MRDAFPPPMCCVVVFIHLRMETPLCGRSGGHTGAAPTVSFGRLISLGGLCANGYFICVGLRDAFPPRVCCLVE